MCCMKARSAGLNSDLHTPQKQVKGGKKTSHFCFSAVAVSTYHLTKFFPKKSKDLEKQN